MLILAVLGAIVQYKFFYQLDEDKKAQEHFDKQAEAALLNKEPAK